MSNRAPALPAAEEEEPGAGGTQSARAYDPSSNPVVLAGL
jgi:hypothetical protein